MDPSDVETVFVAGASGGTGRATLRLLSSRVSTVRALTSTPSKTADLEAAGADEVVVDDLLNPTALTDALSDVDAVLSAVGSDITDVWSRDEYVDGAGTINLLDGAVEAGVEAFVMESAIGVGDEPASPLAAAFDVLIQPIQRAKAEAEAAIREAPVRHTILRPGVLTNGPRTDTEALGERFAGRRGPATGCCARHAGGRRPDARSRSEAVVPEALAGHRLAAPQEQEVRYYQRRNPGRGHAVRGPTSFLFRRRRSVGS